MSAEIRTFPERGSVASRPAAAEGAVVVALPTIRSIGPVAGPIYTLPTLADQARAVGELIDVMRDLIIPQLPLGVLGDGTVLIDRLTAAAATLRRLAGEG